MNFRLGSIALIHFFLKPSFKPDVNHTEIDGRYFGAALKVGAFSIESHYTLVFRRLQSQYQRTVRLSVDATLIRKLLRRPVRSIHPEALGPKVSAAHTKMGNTTARLCCGVGMEG